VPIGIAVRLQPWVAGIGIILLVLAILASVIRSRSGNSGGGGGSKMWRGERITYGSPYGEGILNRLRRMLRGR
jgi:hypothetical protein